MTLGIFLSFEHAHKKRAIWLADTLRAQGYQVLMEDDFGVESPRREMDRAVQASDVVVALVTPAYANSMATQHELDLAGGFGKPVVAVFAGLSSRSIEASHYVTYRRLELPDPWNDTDVQWTEMSGLLNRALAEQLGRAPSQPPIDEPTALATERAVLLYDFEDLDHARKLMRTRPGWRPPDDGADTLELTRVLLWTTASAETHSLARRDFQRTAFGASTFLIAAPRAPDPPQGVPVFPLAKFVADADACRDAAPLTGTAARKEVERLLRLADETNHRIPIDVFLDRFCCTWQVSESLDEAYELAVREMSTGDVTRLTAVCEYALALRFYGAWPDAVGVIDNELRATSENLSKNAEIQILRLRLEKISLEYELGNHQKHRVDQDTRIVQRRFRELGSLHGYVQAGRVLGDVLQEQGEFDEAEHVLQRTIGVAEYLAEHTREGGPGQLLLADCHRELAALFIARRDFGRAHASLAEARELVSAQDGTTNLAGSYLSAVLDYFDAVVAQRDDLLVKVTTPTEQVQAALDVLVRFGNPIRVAVMYNWLGRAWTRQVPRRRDDLLRGKAYLLKALRIRQDHGHSYTYGKSHQALGELYQALDELDEGIWHYGEGRRIFNRLGAKPALALANAALARSHFDKFQAGDKNSESHYAYYLAEAERQYNEIHLGDEAIELRYELEHGGRKAIGVVTDDRPLIAVGEYLLHKWIQERAAALNPGLDRQFELTVGIGDDAAVLTPKGVEPDYSLVFTTDSAPGSLSRLDRSPEYVGRFAVVQTLADVIAMGARPVGLLVNMFLSRAATVGYVKRLVEAVNQEARHYGVPIVGGDIKERNEQSVGVVGIGCVEHGKVLTRNAARPGQVVGITLATDRSGAGTRKIGGRWAQELVEHYRMNSPEVLRAFPALADIVNPELKYNLLYAPVKVMAAACSTGHLRAAIDTSDGVLACLEIIGRDSNVGFELDEQAVDAVIDENARSLAGLLGLASAIFLFSAGHDWEIVFTCAEDDFPEVAAAVQRELRGNGRVVNIGKVTERRPDSDVAVMLRRSDGALAKVVYYTDEKFVPRVYQDRPSQWLEFASRYRPL